MVTRRTDERRPNVTMFLGYFAEPQFNTDNSVVFELYEKHNSRESSLVGWLDIHYPCRGPHVLHLRVCLNPEIATFDSHVNFGGDPSAGTTAKIEQLIREVIQYMELEPDVTWQVDLQARGVGTFFQNPQTFIE